MSRLAGRLLRLPRPETRDVAVERGLRIPMRDGVDLLADRWCPEVADAARRPVLLARTPYGRTRDGFNARLLAERGYQVVVVSCRGTFGSGGELDPLFGEADDGQDVFAWLARQPWCDAGAGVGTLGGSYVGHTQWAVAVDPPPLLRAMAPSVTTAEFADLFRPGGTFALATVVNWLHIVDHQEDPPLRRLRHLVAGGKAVAAGVHATPIDEADVAAVGHRVPWYRRWVAEDDPRGAYWSRLRYRERAVRRAPPVTLVAGWYDLFLPHQLADYAALRAAGREVELTIGPWHHISPGLSAEALRTTLAWMDRHLRGSAAAGAARAPVRIHLQRGRGRRAPGRWVDLPSWPPPSTPERWYLQPAGGLSPALPPAGAAPDPYRYDPGAPTPVVGGATLDARNLGPKDQRRTERHAPTCSPTRARCWRGTSPSPGRCAPRCTCDPRACRPTSSSGCAWSTPASARATCATGSSGSATRRPASPSSWGSTCSRRRWSCRPGARCGSRSRAGPTPDGGPGRTAGVAGGAPRRRAPLAPHPARLCGVVRSDSFSQVPSRVRHPEVNALIERSNRLGSDRRITNHGGGNTSAKVTLEDPVTGEPVAVLAVKGSGGDLGTLTEAGLAFLRLDRLRALERLHAAGTREDDLVARYGECTFGSGGAVPSIDTPLHGLIDAAHVDHLHPDAVIALATAADGEALVARCYGREMAWLPWRRPGFELGLALRDLQRARPEVVGAVLGGHGVICWADSSEACEALSRRLIATAEVFLAEHGRPDPLGPARTGFGPLPPTDRRAEAVRLAPVIRGIAGRRRWVVGHFSDDPAVLELLAHEAAPRLAALGTSCPDHFLRTKVRPLLLDLPPGAPFDERVARLYELADGYRAGYRAYYDAHAGPDSPAMRGDDPVVVLVPGVGMFSHGPDPASARIAGEFYVNAVNVMRGAEAVSRYTPIPDAEKFRVEYWELEERKLRMRPPAPVLTGRVAIVTGGASGIGFAVAQRLAGLGANVVVVDLDEDRACKAVADLPEDRAAGIAADVTDEAAVDAAVGAAVERFGGIDLVVNNAGIAVSAPLVDTTLAEWERLHAVLARGSFLVARAAARTMIAQGLGGDIVYVVSKNAVVAGPENVAYGAAKADQAHQVRLLAAELGRHGIRVNGVNPDGVVRGSGIFSGEWLEQRAGAYGVAPEALGAFYASRTLLGQEVLPEHVADAVATLVSGGLSRTTGLLVPVDGGLPAAFLR